MQDKEDLKLKAELDEIMKSVDIIMKKVETVIPAKPEETQPDSEWTRIPVKDLIYQWQQTQKKPGNFFGG